MKGTNLIMSASSPIQPVLELRVALTTNDYERLVKFYCEGLGLEPAAIWNNDGGRALILEMGKATLELFDETQAQVIDQLEAGQRVTDRSALHSRYPI
jgi:methylmalonyl-CoA/ethylmalonyl-CoA epimerase